MVVQVVGYKVREDFLNDNMVRRVGDRWQGGTILVRCLGGGCRFQCEVQYKEVQVCEMGEWEGNFWHWKWQWRRQLFQCEVDLLDELGGCLNGVRLQRHVPDGWVWRMDNSSCYLVKSAFKAIIDL